ncbi:MAG: EAL domain-containing protein [Burkholderiales bacterium]|nr:EAL domain-containing protein [Burkholderiales bacterium]
MLRMNDYNPVAKTYWWITALLGGAVLVLAVRSTLTLSYPGIAQAGFAIILAGVAGAFPYRLAGGKTSISAAETVIFLALVMTGPASAALAAAAEGAVASSRTSARWTSRIGTPAMAGLAMYASGTLYVLGVGRFTADGTEPTLLVQLAFLLPTAVAYFASGTLLVASVFTLKQRLPLRPWTILRSHGWMAIVYLASAALAALLHAGYEHLGAGVFVAALPLVAGAMLTYRLHARYLEDRELAHHERVAAAQREATESARHLAALQASENRFQKAFAHAAIGMALVTHERIVLQANPALCSIVGRDAASLIGSDFGAYVHREDRAALDRDLSDLLAGIVTTCTVELRCIRPDRSLVAVALHAAFFSATDDSAPCLIFQLEDITARQIAEGRLRHIAHHDDLTGLPNRAHFFGQVSDAIKAAQRDPTSCFAVLFLDCDRFKTINDSLGHRIGDELLVVLGRRIAAQVRPTDAIARLGGDEFAILARGMCEEDAVTLAKRLQRVVSEPVHIRAAEISTTVAIGIAMGGPYYRSPEDVMRDADLAMYRAKAQGRAQYAIFDTALRAELSSQMQLEGALRRALEDEELHLAYQPIFDLHTGRMVGVEALCRWTHAERGAVPPERFIRVAEESGLIVPLGRWVLEAACRQLALWYKALPTAPRFVVHVNVSGAQLLQTDFVERVLDIVDRAAIPRESIALEVTESVLFDSTSMALPNLRQLRAAGLQISIDDFGTGYSSFARMWDLPVGEIKIDRSFVARLACGREGEEVLRAMIAMGRAMGKRIVAEGVETEAQSRTLRDLGCHEAQGFWHARPLDPDEIHAMLQASPVPALAT